MFGEEAGQRKEENLDRAGKVLIFAQISPKLLPALTGNAMDMKSSGMRSSPINLNLLKCFDNVRF